MGLGFRASGSGFGLGGADLGIGIFKLRVCSQGLPALIAVIWTPRKTGWEMQLADEREPILARLGFLQDLGNERTSYSVVSLNTGTPYRPQNSLILNMGDPEKVTLIWKTPMLQSI